MELLNVIAAGIASYIFGAIWYMTLSGRWMEAAGIVADENGRPPNAGPVPYIVALVGSLFVAGMMRHIFALAGIDSLGKGVVAGLGIGLFLVTPWIATNYVFADRSRNLIWIDAGFATGGCTVIALVLTLF